MPLPSGQVEAYERSHINIGSITPPLETVNGRGFPGIEGLRLPAATNSNAGIGV